MATAARAHEVAVGPTCCQPLPDTPSQWMNPITHQQQTAHLPVHWSCVVFGSRGPESNSPSLPSVSMSAAPPAHAPGAMPDFSRMHKTEQKRDALFKSSSTKSLTEFREFKLNSSRVRRTGATAAAAPAPAGSNGSVTSKENTTIAPITPRTSSHTRIPAPAKPLANNTSRDNVVQPAKPKTAAVSKPPVPLFHQDGIASTPKRQQKVIPPVPLFTESQQILSVVSSPAVSTVPVSAPLSLEELDDEFAVDTVSIADILNDDAWKDEEEPPVPLPLASSSFHSFNGGVTSLFSATAPVTPLRRTTLNGTFGSTCQTPRTAARGSIYGGALRTPNRVKDPNSSSIYTISTPARLTISGVLPSASLSRSVGASSSYASTASLDTSARRVPTTPAASPALSHRRQQSVEIAAAVGSTLKELSIFSASVPVPSSTPARSALLLTTPAKRVGGTHMQLSAAPAMSPVQSIARLQLQTPTRPVALETFNQFGAAL